MCFSHNGVGLKIEYMISIDNPWIFIEKCTNRQISESALTVNVDQYQLLAPQATVQGKLNTDASKTRFG